ncbi:hypothetical protein U0033_23185 [Chitinophaga sancti]|uniref:Uncharacterized protein n=2 Tax=Chitinophaga sancti TaxID=1004 RepID=A0ABZ0X8Y8_9BACT|nr:hypothetical protein [Chitinophaga sancti]WQD60807.1 hypothetical protein U0033_23185 [Chitinophaga sancti]WQG87065.1 hypothetical protein SR876_19285 [Chitinophaga sancti]
MKVPDNRLLLPDCVTIVTDFAVPLLPFLLQYCYRICCIHIYHFCCIIIYHLHLFYQLAATLKILLLDYPKGLHLPVRVASITLTVKVSIKLPNLLLSLTLPDQNEEFCNETIHNYDQLTEDTLKQALLSIIGRFGISYENIQENEDMLNGLIFALTVDNLSMAGGMAINELERRSYHTSRMSETYGLLLSKYLDAIFRNNPILGREISERLFYDHRYRLPFFRRVVLHNISIHFKEYKGLFAELIEPNDPHQLFTGYTYRTELFNLLKSNQKELNSKEALLLEEIIAQGPQDEKEIDEDRLTYWQAPWLLALNQREPFDHLYTTVKKRHELKDWDIDPSRTITLKNGSIPPMSSEQLLDMEDSDLVLYLMKFNPKNRWEEPNISGLARILEAAVALKPIKFINALLLYLPVPYIYIHYVLYALLEYGKKNKDDFDWASIIRFTLIYIKQNDFESEARFLKQDSWHADKNWICSVASVLVSEVCSNDDYVRVHQLLPICRQIIIKVNQHLEVSDFSVPSNNDYLSKSFNSDSGKLLRACIDYSLCRPRLTNIESPDWEEDICCIFNRFIAGGDSDSYTLLGCYWPQLNYLQPTWLDTQITELIQLPQPQWTAFMGGLLSSSAPGTMEKLDLFLPHYYRGIDTHLQLINFGYNGFATHLTSLFFWQLDNIKEDSLIVRYLSNMPMEAIKDLLHAVWFNEEYLASLAIKERQQLEERVIALIQLIHKTYSDSSDTEVLEMRRSTVNLVYFIAELNEENAEMIRIAIQLITKSYHSSNILKKLHELMSKGDHQKSAQYLASILDMMTFREHPLEGDQHQLEAMIQFLFNHNQIETASTLCNRLSRSNYAFAKTLYLKNTAT